MAAESVGQIGLDLVVNQNQFKRQMSGITGLAKKAGAALAAAFAVKKIVQFGNECIKLGSDLAEVQNVVDVTFPAMTAQVDKFAKSAAGSFGLSETMAKRFTGTFGAMAKAFGFSEQAAYDMSTTLTGLSGDIASFYNISQDEAYTKLKSVFTGETETLKDLGVVMTQSALDAYALANGFGKTTQAMSEAEKVALRYQFVQSKLSAAQGDFARTSDSWANQTRLLSLQFDSLKASIGQGLISAFTPVIRVVNTLLAKVQVLADAFKNLMTGIFGAQQSSGGMQAVADAAVTAESATGSMADNTDSTAKSAKKAQAYMAGFDEINKVSKPDASGAEGASGAAGIGIAPASIAESEKEVSDSTGGMIGKLKAFSQYLQSKFAPTFQTVWENLKNPVNDFRKNIGQVFSDIGQLATPVWSYFDGSFVPMLQQFVLTAGNVLAGLLDSFNTVFSDIWSKAVYPNIQLFITVILPIVTDFVTRCLDAFSVLFDEVKKIFDRIWSEGVAPALDLITSIWLDAWDTIKSAYDKWAAPIFENLKEAFRKTGEILQNVWESILKPIWDTFMQVVDELWTNHLQPLLANFLDFVGELANGALEIYNKFIAPIVNWFTTVFGPIISDAISGLIKTVGGFIGNIVDAASGIITALKGIIQFITGIFTGNWKKAWEGIKNIFKGVFDALVNIVKMPINAIIGIINGMIRGIVSGVNAVIRAINSIGFDMPDWLGGGHVGFNIKEFTAPQIPMLAQGGFVKANTPRLAMIGDNPRYGEIVAPENKMQAMVDQAVARTSAGNQEIIQLLKTLISLVDDGGDIVLMIDNEELARVTQKGALKLKRRRVTTDVEFA